MADLIQTLQDRLAAAIERVAGAEHAGTDPLLRPSAQPRFGDYQANVAMSLGKAIGTPPRKLAEAIVTAVGSPA